VSGWLHNLVLQARGADRTVRPVPIGYRSPAFSPEADAPSPTPEISSGVDAAPTSARAASAPAVQAQWARDTHEEHQRPEMNAPSAPMQRAPTTQREHDPRDRDDSSVRPARDSVRSESSNRDDLVDRDVRRRRGRETPVADEAAQVQTLPVAAPRRTESTASLIRPAMPPRAAPARDAADVGRPAPVPDVHIHIGRIELTAVTAPAPRRERAAAPNNSMSLDEYLRRRNRGAR
jgi:hypothetical protein